MRGGRGFVPRRLRRDVTGWELRGNRVAGQRRATLRLAHGRDAGRVHARVPRKSEFFEASSSRRGRGVVRTVRHATRRRVRRRVARGLENQLRRIQASPIPRRTARTHASGHGRVLRGLQRPVHGVGRLHRAGLEPGRDVELSRSDERRTRGSRRGAHVLRRVERGRRSP